MECKTFPDKQGFDTHAAAAMKGVIYQPLDEIGTVTLSFAKIPAKLGATLHIYSRKVDALVYQGLITPSVELSVDSLLSTNDGWDNLAFAVFDQSNLRICNAINDRDAKIWHPDASLKITFYQYPKIDEHDLMSMFKIEYD